MIRRRRRRRTDWLFADALTSNIAVGSGTTSHIFGSITIPILPTQYVDQDANGNCTLLRIVGDIDLFHYADTNITTGAQPTEPSAATDLSLLVTEVDDSGAVNQVDVSPYFPPDLGASATVGGARDFLWARRMISWITNTDGSVSIGTQAANSILGFSANSHPSFDLRVKRRLRTGLGLVLVHSFLVPFGTSATGTWSMRSVVSFAYRLLVAR